jgi:hypothetical protein
METIVLAALSVAALGAVAAQRRRLAVALAALCGLVRPEGGVLALLVAGWVLLESRNRMRAAIPALVAVASALLQPAINLALTGKLTATGFMVKSWVYNIPAYPEDILQSIVSLYARVWYDLVRGVPEWGWVMPPLLAGAGLAYFGGGAIAELRQRRVGFLLVGFGWVLVGTFSITLLQMASWHYGRYQLSFVVLLIIGGVCAVAAVASWLPSRWRFGVTWLFIALAIVSTGASAVYAHSSLLESIHVTQTQVVGMSDWLRNNTPQDARIGAHDVGVIAYRSGRYIYDVLGLGSPDTATAWRHGPGAVYEQMERSPNRPTWFATYPHVMAFAYFQVTNLFAEEHATFPMPSTTSGVSISAGEQRIYRADWSLLNSGDRLRQPDVIERLEGLRLVDSLDVADLLDEEQHDYRWWNVAKLPGFATEAKQLAYRVPADEIVMDGGRLLTGGDEMTVRVEPHRDLWLAARLHPQNGARMRVFVDDASVGEWVIPQLAGHWLETVFQVPAEFVSGERIRIRLAASGDDPGFRHYAPYYYWFYQGDSTYRPAAPSYPVSALLGDSIRLLGYDLVTDAVGAGQTFTVTLYWQAVAPVRDSYKVFVHVAAADGSVQAQSDSLPVFDTRTTPTWGAGEIIIDPHRIVIPAGQAAGDYLLTCGLYLESGSMVRLPVKQVPATYEDRVTLTALRIK